MATLASKQPFPDISSQVGDTAQLPASGYCLLCTNPVNVWEDVTAAAARGRLHIVHAECLFDAGEEN